MKIGTLGEIIFEVSRETIMTLSKFSRTKSASLQTHNVHLKTGLVEFTGSSPETISFNIKASKYLGADPHDTYLMLREYMSNGTAVPFIVGNVIFGSYRWVVSKCKATYNYYDKKGNVTDMDISVTLTEYRKE